MKYRTIVADPPWPYPEGFPQNKGGRYGGGSITRAADGTSTSLVRPMPYEAMSVVEISQLPVEELAESSAWLWLWTTNRYLREAFDVAESWGFAYAQTVVWHKSDGHPRFPAVVAPNRAEYLLVCKRGTPKRLSVLASNVIDIPFYPGRYAHSEKPEAFLDHIESICPGPYLELFARRNRLCWDTWGDEALEHVDLGVGA